MLAREPVRDAYSRHFFLSYGLLLLMPPAYLLGMGGADPVVFTSVRKLRVNQMKSLGTSDLGASPQENGPKAGKTHSP